VADLRIDTEVLRQAGTSLRAVYQEFDKADDNARPDRSVIAHHHLRDRLEEFADSWDDRRAEMTEAIKGLGEFAEESGKAFDALENEFVKSLAGGHGK
jgi:hypothetical protein